MTTKAMNDYVLVRPVLEDMKTASGLYLSEKDISPKGIIISAGGLCKNKLRPGDKVLFPRGLVFERFNDGKEDLWIVKEDRVLLVLNDGEASGS